MFNVKFDPYAEYGLSEKSRLVIYDLETKSFIYKEIIEYKEVLELDINSKFKKKNLKYKYQIKNQESLWVDTVYGYSNIIKYSVKELLSKLHFKNNKNVINDSIFLSASEKDLTYCIRHILLDTYNLLRNSTIDNVNYLQNYLDLFPENLLKESGVIAHYHSLMHTFLFFLENEISGLIDDVVAADKYLKQSKKEYKYSDYNNIGFKTGFLVAKGNILSAYTRVLAYEAYQEALNLNTYIVDAFLSIEAITTFYLNVTPRINIFEISHDQFDTCQNNNLNLCFSADAKYFKMYSLNWLQASLYFDNLNYNYGIVSESEEDFNQLVSYYKELLDSLSSMLGIPKNNNTRFFLIKSKTINNTVYACARYQLAHHLLSNFEGNVYITDIDQFVNADINSYLKSIENNLNHDIYLPIMTGIYKYLPGRSHLAGNIFIRNSSGGKSYTKTLVDYISIGLEERYSWMLDQNATRYASEKYDVGSLHQFGKRALQQYPDLKRVMRSKVN